MEREPYFPKSLKILISFLILIVVGCFIVIGLMWSKIVEVEAQIPVDKEAEIVEIVKEIGSFLILPQDESPSLLTLTEVELAAVRGQAFFANALPGDKLLIYEKNSRAVIWRPISKKIIEASIINLTSSPNSAN